MAKLRIIGYKSDQKGILRRYYREREHWDFHLNKCKEFILTNTSDIQNGKLAVLGSGWLLDVPLTQLIDIFDEIWLFDINHPIQVRRKYEKINKVKFHYVDLTNGLTKKALQAKSFEEFEKQLLEHLRYKFPLNFDFVISINILNQLDIILCDYLKKRFNVIDDQLENVRQVIQSHHVELMQEHKGCLITDCVENYIDLQGQIINQENLIFADLPDANKNEFWDWQFDTHRNYRQKFNTSFTVNAYLF